MTIAKFSNEDLTRWKAEINPAPIIGTRVTLRRENAEYVGCCPDVYHVAKTGHPDHHPSFKVYKLDAGVWGFKCFSCGANGNVFQFVQDFDGIGFKAAVAKVLAEAGIEGFATEEQQEAASKFEPAPAEVKNYVTFTLKDYAPAITAFETATGAHKWLKARGISLQTAKRFLLGYVQSAEKITKRNDWINDGWILFPTLSADGQMVTSVKYRSLIAKKVKKANGSENSGILRAPHTSTTMYNMAAVVPNEDIWIVEGEPDTLVMDQAGLNTVGMPMVEYPLSDEECEILSSVPKRRFLAGDSDAIGGKARDSLKKRLRGETYVIRWPNNRKDANDVLTNECGNDPEKFKALVEDLKARATQKETEAVFRSASDVTICRINWLWENKIPLGKITLFAGNPDNGKSLATSKIAADVTQGAVFPECKTAIEPSDVLMLLGEDDLEDTAVPRLKAAGADLSRIHFLIAARPVNEEDREVQLDLDIPAIEHHLEKNPSIRLIIIDPISNYLGDVNMVAEQEVRKIMIPLKRAAENHNVAIVVVMHLNKKSDLDAISRVGGAMAFIGVARCSWLFARNVAEETDEGDGSTKPPAPDTFSMLRIKNNLVSSNKAGMSYSVGVTPVNVPNGAPIITPYVIWGTTIEGSADEALGRNNRQSASSSEPRGPGRPSDKLQSAISWLEKALQDGEPHATKILKENARGEAAITPDTLDRAWKTMGAKSKKVKGIWSWYVEPMGAESNNKEPQQSDLVDIG